MNTLSCWLCRQAPAWMVIPLDRDRVQEMERLYPELLVKVVRPHWLNTNPVEGQLYLHVCKGCWAEDRGGHDERCARGDSAGEADHETQAREDDSEDEMTAAIADSLRQADEDEGEDMLAQAIAASLAPELGSETGGDCDEDLERALVESLHEARRAQARTAGQVVDRLPTVNELDSESEDPAEQEGEARQAPAGTSAGHACAGCSIRGGGAAPPCATAADCDCSAWSFAAVVVATGAGNITDVGYQDQLTK